LLVPLVCGDTPYVSSTRANLYVVQSVPRWRGKSSRYVIFDGRAINSAANFVRPPVNAAELLSDASTRARVSLHLYAPHRQIGTGLG
jgi:hypothetical protein